METDGTEGVDKRDVSEKVLTKGENGIESPVVVALQNPGNTIFYSALLKAEYRNPVYMWSALLEVQYSWNDLGTEFTCRPLRYAAANNGRREGNVLLGFRSAENWQMREITQNAIQDGQWHNIEGGGSISGNSEFAILSFLYVYDEGLMPDTHAGSDQVVLYSLNPPVISNPEVVREPRPEISGFGIPKALVKLYQQDVYDVPYGDAPVGEDGKWTVPVTKSLSMTERFSMTASQTVDGTPSRWAIPVSFAVLFAPEITDVSVRFDRTLIVNGKGGFTAATIEVWLEDKSKGIQLTATVRSDGTWGGSSRIALPPGHHLITARQIGKVSGQVSGWATSKTTGVKPDQLLIESPPYPGTPKQVLIINGVVPEHDSVQILTDDDKEVDGKFHGPTRSFTPTEDWAPGLTPVRAVQTVDGLVSEPSKRVHVSVRPSRPVIADPPKPVAARQVLTIQSVLPSASLLAMTTEEGVSVAGEFAGSGTTRTFTPKADWTGTTRVRVVQTLDNVPSEPSFLVTLWVSLFITPPDDPAAVNEVLNINYIAPEVRELMIYKRNGPKVEGRFTGAAPSCVFIPRDNWALGYTHVSAIQVVGSESSHSNVVTITVLPPKLSIGNPPNLVSNTYQPFLVGAESAPGLLKLLTAQGERVDGYFTNDSPRKFQPSSKWAAGVHAIVAVQSLGGVTSMPSNMIYLNVQPKQPWLHSPPKPAEEREPLTIGDVESGAVTVQILNAADGTPVEGEYTGSNTERIFTPTANWSGQTKVMAMQTVDGIDSSLSAIVTVYPKPSKPKIEPPFNPASPRQVLTVSDVLPETVTLRMYTAANERVDGDFSPSGASRTFTPTNDWAFGRTTVKVILSKDGINSDSSDLVTVVVQPPELLIAQPQKPVAPNQQLNITYVVPGIVTLYMSNEMGDTIDGEFTDCGFFHSFTPKVDWVGTTQVKATQAVDDVFSNPSNLVTVAVTPKPPKPVVIHPLSQTSHLANVIVEGTCAVGAEVLVQDADGGLLDGEVSYDQMKWFFKYQWQPGKHQIQAVQTLDGQPSDPSDVLDFYIRPPQLVIEQPHSPVAVRGELKISNVSSGSVALRMSTQMDIRVDGEFAGDGATRTFTPEADWSSGENKVKVVQTVNSVDSDPSDLCTFTVESADKPEPPKILEPQRGARTSRYPTIKVAGLPGALHTVRLEESDELHKEAADADGVLEFTLSSPLVPGDVAIQVMQASGGADSDWSDPHPFTIKAPPQTPMFTVPSPGGNAARNPLILGRGETGGEIVLCHMNDTETPFGSVPGSRDWRWRAEKEWPLAAYCVRAQQRTDGDCSEWTEPHAFYVVDSTYAIGDADPVIGMPVAGTGQSVLLRVQVISGVSDEAAKGIAVEWYLNGQQELLAVTETDAQGWAQLRYTPATVGKSEVLADITRQNDGVVMTALYEVTAVAHNEWAKDAELYLDGERIDLAVSDLALLRRHPSYKLELKVKDGSALIGTSVTLQDFWNATERGLTCVPDFGFPLQITQGLSTHWYIATEKASSGIFGFNLVSSLLPDWQLPGRVEADDLCSAVDIKLDKVPQVFGSVPAYPCLGAKHEITVTPRSDSVLLGQEVTLQLSPEALDLGVTVSPSTAQILGAEGASWLLDCENSTQAGSFSAWLRVPAWDFDSLKLPMSLGHNKVRIAQSFGPEELAFPPGNMKYGILVESTFTGQAAAGVVVTATYSGRPPSSGNTGSDGQFFVYYIDWQNARLSILNRYDGTIV